MNYLHNYAVMPEFWIKHRLRKATVKLLNIDACSVTNERRPLTFWFLILLGVDNATVSVCHSFFTLTTSNSVVASSYGHVVNL